MAGVETIWELHTLSVIYSWWYILLRSPAIALMASWHLNTVTPRFLQLVCVFTDHENIERLTLLFVWTSSLSWHCDHYSFVSRSSLCSSRLWILGMKVCIYTSFRKNVATSSFSHPPLSSFPSVLLFYFIPSTLFLLPPIPLLSFPSFLSSPFLPPFFLQWWEPTRHYMEMVLKTLHSAWRTAVHCTRSV